MDLDGVESGEDLPVCQWCHMVKLLWHESDLCAVCDNRDDGEAVWFDAFAEDEASRSESDGSPP